MDERSPERVDEIVDVVFNSESRPSADPETVHRPDRDIAEDELAGEQPHR